MMERLPTGIAADQLWWESNQEALRLFSSGHSIEEIARTLNVSTAAAKEDAAIAYEKIAVGYEKIAVGKETLPRVN
jgi:ATP/maltotriose-dependent transcriptional regulator MalT